MNYKNFNDYRREFYKMLWENAKDYIPFKKGRPDRIKPINKEDINNLRIDLENSKDVLDIIK